MTENQKQEKELKIFEYDPGLLPYRADIEAIMARYEERYARLTQKCSLSDVANQHHYFGFHKAHNGWYYREWAPGADRLFLTGDMVDWKRDVLELEHVGNGCFELFLPGADSLYDGCRVKVLVHRNGEVLDRIPLFIRRVEQDSESYAWNGVIIDTPEYVWQNDDAISLCKDSPLIYECHIGMAQEKEAVGSYCEFRDNILPKVRGLGYNTIQIMAIMEHPYYGSFGYQVSSFFAASSRFGSADDLKSLVDTAHGMGIRVLLDVVHSHAVKNTAEGIYEFDGTQTQFFHEGERGDHPAWGTKLFNYGMDHVVTFLLSNLKFWLEEYHFDGFRFDGVTSMLYLDHGLGVAFTDYGKYYSLNTDVDAITYLQLANTLIREIRPHAITIAEDMSGMPGMCLPIEDGGIGFDYRLAMGEPDLWIKMIEQVRDEDWDMWRIWWELSTRRPGEKNIGYAESHDQALVGDKTIMFRLCDSNMYYNMSVFTINSAVERGIALHKLIRLATLTVGGEGYLNFMGNEFGHPEWIDFPREGNGWSHFYCRRQWSLAQDKDLMYCRLEAFDKAMISLVASQGIFDRQPEPIFIDNEKKVLVYRRADRIFVLNFHPDAAYENYWINTGRAGVQYRVLLSTDRREFGGWDRISEEYVYTAWRDTKKRASGFGVYIPARSGLCLGRISKRRSGAAKRERE